MSQGKTRVPGMDDVNSGYSRSSTYQQQPYTPNVGIGDKTHVPGMELPGKSNSKTVSTKPIVGMLYSISKTSYGEFWPLYLGANVIGRSADCDIILNEATISEHHAEIVVRSMKKPEKIIASIRDSRSTCGSLVNGESLGFEPKECFDRDIITIGEHYEMLFILIDIKKIGLKVSEDFMGTEEEIKQPFAPPISKPFDPTAPMYDSHNAGTVGLDGAGSDFGKGGTKTM